MPSDFAHDSSTPVGPDFFILGAPKCGTTSLATWLQAHPQIFIGEKEPNYFSSDIVTMGKSSFDDYLRLFQRPLKPTAMAADASTSYLYSEIAVPKILDWKPKAKFIVMLRNPVDMFLSLHGELVWNEHECFTDPVAAWQAQQSRAAGTGRVGRHCYTPAMLQYRSVCQLGLQVSRLLRHVDRTRVHAIFLDDLMRDPALEYELVLSFLGLETDGRTTFEVANSRKAPKSSALKYLLRTISDLKYHSRWRHVRLFGLLTKVNALNTSSSPRTILDEHFKSELIETFRPDVELLSRTLSRDLSPWFCEKQLEPR